MSPGVNADFLDQVTTALAPGKCAALADISEEWVAPLDTKMEALGGDVFRAPKKTFEDEQRAKDVAALRTEIDELKAEHARARSDRKGKIQAHIDKLSSNLQGKFDEAKLRSNQIRSEAEAKIKALQKKAGQSQAEMKGTLQIRATEIQKDYEQKRGQAEALGRRTTEAGGAAGDVSPGRPPALPLELLCHVPGK